MRVHTGTHVFACLNQDGEWRIVSQGTEQQMREKQAYIRRHHKTYLADFTVECAEDTKHWPWRVKGEPMRNEVI